MTRKKLYFMCIALYRLPGDMDTLTKSMYQCEYKQGMIYILKRLFKRMEHGFQNGPSQSLPT